MALNKLSFMADRRPSMMDLMGETNALKPLRMPPQIRSQLFWKNLRAAMRKPPGSSQPRFDW